MSKILIAPEGFHISELVIEATMVPLVVTYLAIDFRGELSWIHHPVFHEYTDGNTDLLTPENWRLRIPISTDLYLGLVKLIKDYKLFLINDYGFKESDTSVEIFDFYQLTNTSPTQGDRLIMMYDPETKEVTSWKEGCGLHNYLI
ncbi:MAG: hypothetical protein EHM79_00225 [Geobacter sp.]|nr:MAG: hypothetical protein EHM79_00225 [Geobacter sp.]